MSRLYLVVILLFFAGCGIKDPLVEPKDDGAKKIYKDEDLDILRAIQSQREERYGDASKIYMTLYTKSKKQEYLNESLRSDMALAHFDSVLSKTQVLVGGDELEPLRIRCVALLELGRSEEALQSALHVAKISKSGDDDLLVADIYIKMQRLEESLAFLQSAYQKKGFDEQILDKIAIILYADLHRQKDAISKLESHMRVQGCSRMVCARLISFYAHMGNTKALQDIYFKLYEVEPNEDLKDKIVQVCIYNKEYKKLREFLEKEGDQNEFILQLYVELKEYKKAYELSQKLYDRTHKLEFLAQAAIFFYEGSEDKSNKQMQAEAVLKFEEVLKLSRDSLYLNYLGYLLIDHDIDVGRGIELVKEALKQRGDSIYYLDSLAWGYFKQGRCKEAKEVMDRVVSLGGDDNEEVQMHIKEIDKCLKVKK